MGLLLGLTQAAPGDFPTTVLNTEEFNNFVIDEKPYDGPFWTKWSNPYGCDAEDYNPFAPTKAEGSFKFCRAKTGTIIPEAIQEII